MSDVIQLIHLLPKAELHCHIEGTLEPELMFALAQKNNISIPYKTPEEVRQAYEFTDLQSFLDIYYAGAAVLQTQADFFALTWAYLKRCEQDNVRHVEIFFDPQTHLERNISFSTVIKGIYSALQEGERQLGISFKLIMCFLRHCSEASAFETLEQALPYKEWITAVGLDSGEKGNPPEKFERVFAKAAQEGLLAVAHAGEEGPADYIWQAIRLLNVKRIDHGVRCMEDLSLLSYLKEKQIPLTICPLSNIKLRVFQTMQDHNIKKLMDEGLCITINSDDPAYFGGYMNDNYRALTQTFHLTAEDLVQLAKNSFIASFISEDMKQVYCAQVDSVKNAWLEQGE